ncbi:MAG: hypothetical protein AAFV25_21045 [Bacteroidota bacterium]
MNAERFAEILNNPSHLYQLTYQELRSLLLEYPFCASLQQMVAIKAVMENHKEADKQLKSAAIYSPDRSHLYRQIQNLPKRESRSANYVITEDFLELSDLSSGSKAQDSAEALPPASEGQLIWLEENINDSDIEDISFDLVPEESSPTTNETHEKTPPLAIELDNMPPDKPKNPAPKIFFIEDLISDLDATLDISEQASVKDLEEAFDALEEPLPQDKQDSSSLPAPATPLLEQETATTEEEPLTAPKPDAPPRRYIPLEITNAPQVNAPEGNSSSTNPLEQDDMAIVENASEQVEEENNPSPLPKSSFSSWLKKYPSPRHSILKTPSSQAKAEQQEVKPAPKPATPPQYTIEDLSQSKAKKTPSAPKPKLSKKKQTRSFANRSLEENAEIVSETLAEILAKQGNFEKAIEMYERLSLIFPEKSTFFAERIKKLKNL